MIGISPPDIQVLQNTIQEKLPVLIQHAKNMPAKRYTRKSKLKTLCIKYLQLTIIEFMEE